MGYDVRVTDMHVRIKLADGDSALNAMKEFNTNCPPAMKRGHSSADGRRWFSWMKEDFSQYATLEEALGEMGFSVKHEGDWLTFVGWHGDKQGQEDLLMESIAGYVEHGSFVNWIGEDCERYRWEFISQRLLVREGTSDWNALANTPTELRIKSMREMDAIMKLLEKAYPEITEKQSNR